MKFKKSRIINSIFFCFIILSFYSCGKTSSKKSSTYTLLVSMDGFRWDYEQMAETPTLDSIARTGVKAASLIPSFPTKTFPNHYTLATGLYPDHHGIVLNGFYAPDLEKYYAISKRESVENPAFYNGEPIWVSAEKQDLITASYFWVGSETPIEGIQPTYWKQYEHNFPFEQRVDSVIKWLNLPYAKRPHLVMLYFHEPDHVGHVYGPESDSTLKTVESLDALLGRLCKKLRQLDIADSLNLIVLSDHGMASFDDVVFLDDHIYTAWFEEIQGWNPNYVFKAKSDYYDTAFAVLSAIPGMHLWKHGELPNRLHYGNNPRTLDFIAAA
ncbi:MAG: ectonucleotide pyrophosphatase/phosphodiesterase, partial [Bacteroidales bacterium]|nr:ectonucleotide pyrophosphatase/phosphodiesterase [Bacteroidales bacterium]